MGKIISFLKKYKIIRYLLSEINFLVELIVVGYPNSRLGMMLRVAYWKKQWSIGVNPKIYQHAIIHGTSQDSIDIGDNLAMGPYAIINAGPCNGLFIGDNVSISLRSFIRTANHSFEDINKGIEEQGYNFRSIKFNDRLYSIVIEDGAWIAPHSILLSGAHIGKGAIVSAGSVVSGYVPDYSIVVGNPGRVVSNRVKKGKK